MKRLKERHFDAALSFLAVCFVASTAFLGGCNGIQSSISAFEGKPRLRKGAYFGSVIPPTYLGPGELGTHNKSEKNGYVYCSKGGFIDTDHLRKSADWTKHLGDITYKHIMKGEEEFTFRLREPSRYHVTVEYPEYWKKLSERYRQDIAREVSIELGQYFAHTACVWHEILTWFGWSWTEIGSEYMSAFSWEDIYSNLLGSRIGGAAMRNVGYDFNQAVTIEIDKELERLGAQPPDVAKEATRQIYGEWYTGGYYFFVDTVKRHFDVGLDGYVSPWVVPGICDDKAIISYRIPDTRFVEKLGFSVSLEIEPRERIKGKVLKAVYADGKGRYLRPEIHFVQIMEHIENQAEKRYGYGVSLPW
ncbi:MAG: DUF4056 domain-containing protein [Planctomycetota bacterium]